MGLEQQSYEAKSVVVGRMPRVEGNEYKTAFIKMYDCSEPLLSETFPFKEIEIPNIKKVVFHNVPLCYYLEGNDLVYNNIKKVSFDIDGNVVNIHIE